MPWAPELFSASALQRLEEKRHQKPLSVPFWDGLMIGRFHPASEDEGLWNRDFRPMRAPIPLLAVRHLVRNDAPFALRHPVLLASYLCRYAAAAPRHLLANFAKQRARRDERPERRAI